jgi:hypothetical protein
MSENKVPEVPKSPGALLADNFYGSDDPQPKPAQEPAPAEEVIDDAVQLSEEGQEEQAEEASEDVASDQGPEDEGFEVTTVEQLAEHLETDAEWLQNLEITQKVNGKEIPVKIADALATHRKVKAGDSYLADAKSRAKGILDDLNAQQEQLNTAIVTAGTLIKAVEDQIEEDVNSVDWAKLRQQDPAEYSVKKDEVRERRDKLQRMRAEALAGYQQVTAQMQQQQEAARLAQLPREQEILVEKIPEWADQEASSKEKEDLVNYLTNEGFDQSEIEFLSYNGKALAVMIKAMRYDKSKGKADVAKKKVRKIPKVLKPGPDHGEQPSKPKKDDPVSILYG